MPSNCAVPFALAIAPATAGTSPFSIQLDCLKAMMANSPRFQLITGSADATEAATHIYRYGYEGPDDEQSIRPYVTFINEDYNYERIATAFRTEFLINAVIQFQLVIDVPAALLPSESDYKTGEIFREFEDNAFLFLNDVSELSGQGGYLELQSLGKVEGPFLNDPAETPTSGQFCWAEFQATI